MKITLLNTNLYLVLFISFVTFSSLAQQNKYSLLKQDVKFIFEELKFMYDYDQALRKYPIEIRNMNFKIIFCIFKVKLMY